MKNPAITNIYRILFRSFLIAVLALSGSACHEDDDEEDGEEGQQGTLYYQGRFIDESVQNLYYELLDANNLLQRRGATDADGSFDYLRNRAFTLRFFLGDNTQEATARLQLGEIRFSASEASTSGIVVSPASLHPDNANLATEISRFLQGADRSSAFGIRLDNLLHNTLAEDLEEQTLVFQATTNIIDDFADVFQELGYDDDVPSAPQARARLDANLLCQAVGAWRIIENENNREGLRGFFVLAADRTATGTVYDEQNDAYALRGSLHHSPNMLLRLQSELDDSPLADAWSGSFNHRLDEISTSNRNFSPDFYAALIDRQLEPPEWHLAVALPGTSTLLVLRVAESTLEGFVYEPQSESRFDFSGEYEADDNSFSVTDDNGISITEGEWNEMDAGVGTADFSFQRGDYIQAFEEVPACRP